MMTAGRVRTTLLGILCATLLAEPASAQGELAQTTGSAPGAAETFDPQLAPRRRPFAPFDLNAPERSNVIERFSDHAVQPPTDSQPRLEPGQARYVELSELEEQQLAIDVRRNFLGAMNVRPVVFSGLVETLDADGNQVSLKALALPGLPLRHNEETNEFEGSMSVGVIEVGSAGVVRSSRQLSAPVRFQVLGAVTTEPALLTVTSTGPPYAPFFVSARVPSGDTDVTVVSNVTPEGEPMVLKVQPKLVLKVSPRVIQGWGFETANVLVSARGGRPTERMTVQLSSEHGRLGDHALTLGNTGTAATTIRSVSLLNTTVTASGEGFDGGTARVRFEVPWRFLLAGLLGSLIGIALRRGGDRPLGARMVVGIAASALVLGLYLLGVNVTGFAIPANAGELGVFVVAGLGAYFGASLLRPKGAT